jgi:type IV pilus assembly protein PilM
MISLDLKNRTIRPIGLDIGHHSIKMIQLAVIGEKLIVHAAEEARFDIDSEKDDQARRDAITAIIKRMLARGGFYGKKTVSCLSSGELKITSVRLTEAENQKAEQVLRREVVQRFGLDPEKDSMDYIVAGNVRQNDEIKNELVLFATDNEIIKNHIGLIEQAGLKPISIDIIPCALFRSFERTLRRQKDRENAVVFVDVGSCYTTIVFGRGGEICFVKQIKIGASNFNSEVAAKLGITSKEAEVLRKELQAETDDLDSPQKIDSSTRQGMIDAISRVADELAREISLCLRYFSVTFRGKRVERAVFTGGGSYEKILLDIMKRQLNVAIEVAQPLRGCEIPDEKINISMYNNRNSQLCEWAIAVGLSLKGWNMARQSRKEEYCRA